MDDQPRWLSDEEMEAWLALVSMLIKLPQALDGQLQRDAGISHFEYQVLAGLSMSPERTIRMSEPAQLADGSPSRLSARRQPPGETRLGAPLRRPRRRPLHAGRADRRRLGEGRRDGPRPCGDRARVRHRPLTKAQIRQLRDIGRQIFEAVDPDGTLPLLKECPCPRLRGQRSSATRVWARAACR